MRPESIPPVLQATRSVKVPPLHMGLTLQYPPGYSDLQDPALASGQPAIGIDLAKMYFNSAFGKVRIETFYFIDLKNGDTVPLPVSQIDGYVYSRNELIYQWSLNSGNGTWISGADSLYYCGWLVDQTTGAVFSDEWYRRSGSHANVTHTNDGLLKIMVIAQRQLKNVVMATSPAYSAITAGWIAQDKPLTQQLAQGMNDDAKFSVVNKEVFYLGEYYDGQTVTLPHSPDDGYAYSAAECKFMFSWRWTPAGNSAGLSEPPLSYGQLGPMIASVNSSGVVSTTVKYIDNGGNLNSTNDGRLAVFAFCTRSATPSGFTLSGFREISFDAFMPGTPLPFDTVVATIVEDIKEALGTPEFFGPTTYANGATIPRPTSVIDPSYTYTRQELTYAWTWSDTTNQTGSNLRVPLFYGNINMSTGLVTLHVKRLPPGGPIVEDNDTLCRISVIVIARRQAQIAAVVDNPTIVPSQNASVGGNAVFDVPTISSIQAVAVVGSINSSNQAFTLASAATVIGVIWNGQLRFDFTQSSTPSTSFSTSFTPDTNDTLKALVYT
jgi:hypothetical protein